MTNRFIDNGNHTISDSLTGLMWQESYAYVETGKISVGTMPRVILRN